MGLEDSLPNYTLTCCAEASVPCHVRFHIKMLEFPHDTHVLMSGSLKASDPRGGTSRHPQGLSCSISCTVTSALCVGND